MSKMSPLIACTMSVAEFVINIGAFKREVAYDELGALD